MAGSKIDFVVTWVDGNDPEWLNEKEKYSIKVLGNATTSNRYRDWNLMKYWFRGIEKYASWVNHIYFVTAGHYPSWLNLNNPKLSLVKHSDYIPEEMLPTFNSSTIEMNLHRIQNLSEQFVLFNDDMFVIADTKETDFFLEGNPCESALLGIISSKNPDDIFPHILVNNSALINKYFVKKEVIRKYRHKYLSFKYGKDLIRNYMLFPFVYFSDFHDLHLASSHLKSVLSNIWELEPEYMRISAGARFRSVNDVNQYLLKDWYMCEGKFEPRSVNWGRKFELGEDDGFSEYIIRQKGKVICLNDSIEDLDFRGIQKKLERAFESILPDKSSFEI